MSWADMASVVPQKICDAAMWRSKGVLFRHHELDLLHGVRSDFDRQILQLSASSTAETFLRRRLGAAAPASSSSLPDGYRIPRAAPTSSTRFVGHVPRNT